MLGVQRPTPRRTKIVATLGPATSTAEAVTALARAGMDAARFNFSHGTRDEHAERAEYVRAAQAAVGRPLALIADLQGPKIRVGKFKDGKVALAKGQKFILDAGCDLGDGERAGLDYKELPRDVEAGAVLLLDDGKIVLDVPAAQVLLDALPILPIRGPAALALVLACRSTLLRHRSPPCRERVNPSAPGGPA